LVVRVACRNFELAGACGELIEAFQGSYDAASDKIVWAVMYQLGPQSFTVTGNWVGETLQLGRTAVVNGLPYAETGGWTFVTPTHRTLVIDATLGGQPLFTNTVDVHKVHDDGNDN